jgi:hypothetical protein
VAKPLPFIPEIGVLGTGSRLGSRRIDNATLRGMVSNYDESSGDFGAWVERVTHIQSRGFCAPGESVGTMGIGSPLRRRPWRSRASRGTRWTSCSSPPSR